MKFRKQVDVKLPRPVSSGRGSFFARPSIWLLGVLVTTILIYLPGLNGPFLFDDPPNVVQPIHAWLSGQTGWEEVVYGNRSGVLGRSLSMLTFLINASISGLAPLSFKVTNLGIHLACGVLIYALLTRLLPRDPQLSAHTKLVALTVSALWLLHPMQVSTVLYVVQRMAQLSTLFTLIALLIYVKSRCALEQGRTQTAWIYLFGLLPLTTIAAILSKENGALVPLFCAVLEVGYFRPAWGTSRAPAVKLFFLLTLLIPGLLLLCWLGLYPQRLLAGYTGRLFTLGERLMSEPRALMDYMGALLLPRGPSLGVYTDDFATSHSLLDPGTTLPAIIGLLMLMAATLWSYRRIPAFFTGMSFYLVGHLLESTAFPLELYFEHRNYLPSLGFFLAIAGLLYWFASQLLKHMASPTRSRRLFSLGVVALLAVLGMATLARASVWSSWETLAAQGAQEHPNSMRAQMDHASNLLMEGRFDEVQQVIAHLATIDNPAARHVSMIDTVLMQCLMHHKTDPISVAQISTMRGEKLQLAEMLAFEMLGGAINGSECQGLEKAQLAEIITNIVDTAPQPDSLTQLWRSRYAASRLYLSANQPIEAQKQALLAWKTGHADPAIGLLLANLDYVNNDLPNARRALAEASKKTPAWDQRNQDVIAKLTHLFEQAPPPEGYQ